MCCSTPSFFVIVYITVVNLFGLYLRFVAFHDYFECYACREMDFRTQDYDYVVGWYKVVHLINPTKMK
jgi:hypothetical protein